MINKKNKTIFFTVLLVICIALIVCFHILEIKNSSVFEPIINYVKKYHIKDIVNIVAILSGISAILVGVASIRISNLGAVREYFQQGDSQEYAAARHNLYQKFEECIEIAPTDVDASNTVSFFHFWGLMVKKKYLPFWVFKSASGHAVIRLYEGLEQMIGERRLSNPKYAEYFEWIYKKCRKTLESAEKEKIIPISKKEDNTTIFFSESELENIGFLKYGKNVLISRKASVYNPKEMVLGDNIRVDDFCILSGNIKMGSYIHISAHTCLIGGERGIILKDFVTVSSRCAVYAMSDDFSGNCLNNSMIPNPYRKVIKGQVVLEEYVSVGTGSTILPNVNLAEGTAIGAMSLVNHSLEGWKIYAGIPCKYIKEREQKMKKLREELQKKIESDCQ